MQRNKYDIDESLETPFNIKNFKRCGKYLKHNLKYLIIALVFSLLATALSLCGPYFTKLIIDIIDRSLQTGSKSISAVLVIALIYFIVVILTEVCNYIRTRVTSRAGQQIIHEIRVDIFEHIQKLSFNYFDSRPRGKILVRVVHYVNNVADFLSNGLINIVVQFMSVIFIVFFMLSLDVKLSLIVLSGVPVFAVFMFAIKKSQRKAWTTFSAKNSNCTAYVSESINGMQITQAFNREEINKGIYLRLLEAMRKAHTKATTLSYTVPLVIENLSVFVRGLLYVSAVVFFVNDHYSAGTVIAMASYASRFWGPIQSIGDIYNSLISTGSYLERIFDTIDEKVDIEDKPGAYELPKLSGKVEFKDVTFGYEEGVSVLEHFNLTVNPGQSIALVGPTGAGKSTVVNLLCRFYDIDSGSIELDGHSISDVTLKSLRSQMGIMLQDSFIFSGTIRDNIRYGKLDATDDEIIAAAKTVCAHDFIMGLEDGYDTVVNEKGSVLSQGQRQLVCFARTVISNPAVLILDEATSSIDTETEKLVQQGIANLLKGRTSFIIAHRLSTIINCDKIMYIDNKGIAESGDHKTLIQKKGLYYKLYTSQLEDTKEHEHEPISSRK